jgi:hypothetical protein
VAAAEAEAKAVYSEVVSDSEVAMRRSAQRRFRLKVVERAPEATEREVVGEGELAQEKGALARSAAAAAIAPTLRDRARGAEAKVAAAIAPTLRAVAATAVAATAVAAVAAVAAMAVAAKVMAR